MRKRTRARECALQILYQVDITGNDHTACLEDYWRVNKDSDGSIVEFATCLVNGVAGNAPGIDKVIASYATNWNINRMAVVDRNILRLAAYELMFLKEIPSKVSINEAVDIAKKYGERDSGKFVNGILDKISKKETVHGEKG